MSTGHPPTPQAQWQQARQVAAAAQSVCAAAHTDGPADRIHAAAVRTGAEQAAWIGHHLAGPPPDRRLGALRRLDEVTAAAAQVLTGLDAAAAHLTDRIAIAESDHRELADLDAALAAARAQVTTAADVGRCVEEYVAGHAAALHRAGTAHLARLDRRYFSRAGAVQDRVGRIAGWLRRDRLRVFRDDDRAIAYAKAHAADVAAAAADSARHADEQLRQDVAVVAEVAHAEHVVLEQLTALAPRLRHTAPPPSAPRPPMLIQSVVDTTRIAPALATAAAATVRRADTPAADPAHGVVRRLGAAHAPGRDLPGAWRARALLVERDVLHRHLADAWEQVRARFIQESRASVDATWDHTLAPYLTARDRHLDAWAAVLRDERAALVRELEQLRARQAEALRCRAALAGAMAAPAAARVTSGGRVAPLLQAAAADAADLLRRHPGSRELLADLDRVATGRAELRVAVVAPMKAGKSTLINAIIAEDVLPSRDTAMTGLPTRVVLDGVSAPTLAFDNARLSALRDAQRGLRRRLTGPDGDALAHANPQLAPAITRLRDGVAVSAATGAAAVRALVADINDMLRLTMMLGVDPPAALRAPLQVRVRARRPGETTVVYVDTPGPDEVGASAVLADIVRHQIDAAHVVVVVVDYTRIGSEAAASIAAIVDETMDTLGRDALWAVINRADQRASRDLDPPATRRLVGNLLRIPPEDADRRIVELSALHGLVATRYLAASDPDGEAGRALRELAFPRRRASSPVSAEDLQTAAQDLLAQSGLTELHELVVAQQQEQAGLLAARAVLRRSAALLGGRAEADVPGHGLAGHLADLRWCLSEVR
ncbi:dynamin family protein [Catellatospora citrea]|uniref:Dynamin N-terminal domain-containing protein n=1 Tax=Catellatospora citrea TaxID=53366 RepID=A0A8J3KB21_9ACTN|nr:dynamin family protein [Catellatospora citrea]RKE11181.1 dynamin family protein [Catellatospora citrea]GIF96646.1 hypothetical protein Cci01nite_17400 [Catellatospora citrea]